MSENDTAPVNTAAKHGDHDRVVMLSLKADGSPDQHDPEIIGDKAFAIEAAKVQFAQQAVSAEDRRIRGVTAASGQVLSLSDTEDPGIAELQKAHEAAEEAAQSQAEQAINNLHQGLGA